MIRLSKEKKESLFNLANLCNKKITRSRNNIKLRREIIDFLESKGYDRTTIYRVINKHLGGLR